MIRIEVTPNCKYAHRDIVPAEFLTLVAVSGVYMRLVCRVSDCTLGMQYWYLHRLVVIHVVYSGGLSPCALPVLV